MAKITGPNYNYASDPYYADLFKAPTLADQVFQSFNDFQTYQNKAITTQQNELENAQLQRKLDTRSKVADAMQSGELSGQNVNAALEQAALESGDVETYLTLQKQKDVDEKNSETEKWKRFQYLKEASPSLAIQFYNENLASKFGMIDPSQIQPDIQVIDGMVYDKNALKPGMRVAPPSKRGGGNSGPNLDVGQVLFTSPDKKGFEWVSPKSDAGRQRMIQLRSQGWEKDSKAGGLDLMGLLGSLGGDGNQAAQDEPNVDPYSASISKPDNGVIKRRNILPSIKPIPK